MESDDDLAIATDIFIIMKQNAMKNSKQKLKKNFIKCSYDDNLSKFELYRSEVVVDVFMERLESDVKRLYTNHLKNGKFMKPLESAEIQNYENVRTCHICETPFGEKMI